MSSHLFDQLYETHRKLIERDEEIARLKAQLDDWMLAWKEENGRAEKAERERNGLQRIIDTTCVRPQSSLDWEGE